MVPRVRPGAQPRNLEKAIAVKRIVTNIASARADAARSFYGDVVGLEVVMNLGWILT